MDGADGARDQLDQTRRDCLDQIGALRRDVDRVVAASADSNADDEHDPEGSTIAFERAQLGAVLQQWTRRLAEVDAASARLDAGGYGRCTDCGGPIPVERLLARPATPWCFACAQDRAPRRR